MKKLLTSIILFAIIGLSANAQLAIIGDSINCASTSYTLANYTGGVTYTWSATGGVTFSPNPAITTTANWTGFSGTSSTFTVTGTDGSQATFTVYQCCGQNNGNNSFTNSTASAIIALYTSVVHGQSIFINGILTINANIEFDNCKVVMGEHATILNTLGYTLKFTDNTQVYSGCSYMWDGIITTGTTSLVIVRDVGTYGTASPTIQDAFYSIVSKNGGVFNITNSTLSNNNLDIVIQAYSGTYSSFIKGSTLTCTRDLYAPYVNQRTYCGVTITELASTWTLGDVTSAATKNTFNNMWYGVISTKTNNNTTQSLTIYNNAFTNINPSYDQAINTAAGICISYTSNPSYTTGSSLTVGGTGANQPNTFGQPANAGPQTCYKGIECYRYTNVNILNNTFTNLAKGIYVDNVRVGDPVNIKNNDFEQIQPSTYAGCTGSFGISTLYTVAAIDIENNTINATSSSAYQCVTGIENQTNQNLGGHSCSTYIFGNTTNQCVIGIYELTMVVTKVNGNTINLPSSVGTTTHYGIGIASCTGTTSNNNQVENNTVNWDAGTPPGSSYVDLLRGIQVQASPYTLLYENNITDMGSGIRCYGTGGSPNYLQCNDLFYCYYGVYIDGGDIGNQGVYNPPSNIAWENAWWDQMPVTYRVYGAMGVAAQCIWVYTAGINTALAPGQYSVGGSFSTVTGTGIGCMKDMLSNMPPVITSEERQNFLDVNSSILGNANISDYTDASLYLMTKNAYEKIKADTSIMYLGLPDDNLYQQFYQRVKASNIGKLDIVKGLISSLQYSAAILQNNSVTPLNTIESNVKTVNNIFLHTWAVEQFAFTPADSATLMDIATQNPAIAGEGVYQARAMLQYFQTDYLNASNKRIAHTTPAVNNNSEVTVYPNPASNTITVQFGNATGENCLFELFDAIGNKVFTKQFTASENTANISLNNIAKGVYICRIMNQNNINLYNNKLVIIK